MQIKLVVVVVVVVLGIPFLKKAKNKK